MARIVQADNYDRDWVPEQFVNIPWMPEEVCDYIVTTLNANLPINSDLWFKVVTDDYKLNKGREG